MVPKTNKYIWGAPPYTFGLASFTAQICTGFMFKNNTQVSQVFLNAETKNRGSGCDETQLKMLFFGSS
jgi:hypothetical protein